MFLLPLPRCSFSHFFLFILFLLFLLVSFPRGGFLTFATVANKDFEPKADKFYRGLVDKVCRLLLITCLADPWQSQGLLYNHLRKSVRTVTLFLSHAKRAL